MIVIVLLSLTVSILIGILTRRITNNRADFFVAGRSLGIWATTSSLTATGIGGSATIVAAVYVYTRGLPGVWMNIAAGLGLILLGTILAEKVRGLGVFSLPQIVEKLYGKKSKFCSSVLVLLAEIAWLALIIQATQLILTALFGFNQTLALLIATAGFVLYTILGGQYAVSFSDIFQSLIMFAGVTILAVRIFFLKGNGIPILLGLPDSMLSFPTGPKMKVLDVISLIFLIGLPHLVGPDIYSKILSAKNGSIARKASILSGIFRIFWGAAIAIIALGAYRLFPDLENPVWILPKMMSTVASPLLSGIVIAALIATMMSSADTILLTGTTVLSNDLMGFFRRESQGLLLPRVFVLTIGLAAWLLAIYLNDVIKTLELAYTVFASGMIVPIIAGFFKDRLKVNERGALASMIGGGGLSLLIKLGVIDPPLGIDPILIGITTGVLLLFVFSLSFKGAKR